MDAVGEDAAGAGMVDAEIFLHDGRRATDLVPRDRPQQPVQGVLDRVSVGEVGRMALFGEAVEPPRHRTRGRQHARGLVDIFRCHESASRSRRILVSRSSAPCRI